MRKIAEFDIRINDRPGDRFLVFAQSRLAVLRLFFAVKIRGNIFKCTLVQECQLHFSAGDLHTVSLRGITCGVDCADLVAVGEFCEDLLVFNELLLIRNGQDNRRCLFADLQNGISRAVHLNDRRKVISAEADGLAFRNHTGKAVNVLPCGILCHNAEVAFSSCRDLHSDNALQRTLRLCSRLHSRHRRNRNLLIGIIQIDTAVSCRHLLCDFLCLAVRQENDCRDLAFQSGSILNIDLIDIVRIFICVALAAQDTLLNCSVGQYREVMLCILFGILISFRNNCLF